MITRRWVGIRFQLSPAYRWPALYRKNTVIRVSKKKIGWHPSRWNLETVPSPGKHIANREIWREKKKRIKYTRSRDIIRFDNIPARVNSIKGLGKRDECACRKIQTNP